jgi:hypothetical protein
LILLGVLLFGMPLSAASVTFTVTGTYGSVSILNNPPSVNYPFSVVPPVENSSFTVQFSTLDSSPYRGDPVYPFWLFPVADGTYTNNGITTNMTAKALGLGLFSNNNPGLSYEGGGLWIQFQLSAFDVLTFQLVGPVLYTAGDSPTNPPLITSGTFQLSAFQNGTAVQYDQDANHEWRANIVGTATLTTTTPEPSTGIVLIGCGLLSLVSFGKRLRFRWCGTATKSPRCLAARHWR